MCAALSTLLLVLPIVAYAGGLGDIDVPEPSESPAAPSDGGGGGGGGDGGDGPPVPYVPPAEPEPEPEPEQPSVMSYNPTVTALHSLNAWLAENESAAPTGVYFLPYLEDFPVSLEDTAAYVVDSDGVEHRFAAVYAGYFNTEVAYSRPDTAANQGAANLVTSKKVYSTTDNTRTLQMLGYDLLLADEKVNIWKQGTSVYASYDPVLVNSGPLTANTVVMDIYKALGQYEWDIQFVWVKDDKLSLATSPLQEQISILTNDEDAEDNNGVAKGIDTAEGSTWVWATRTNPALYWDRCKKDVIFSGGAHNVTTAADSIVGSNVSVAFSKGQSDTVTFGEFCAIARAMMDLYGEPVMTEEERLIMLQAYALDIPRCTSSEITEAVEYLAAKGIIDPSMLSIDKNVTFADIEPILCRIADVGSRLTFKSAVYDVNSELFQKGYVKTQIRNSGVNLVGIEEITNPDANIYNDYFIESVDGVTNFIISDDALHGSSGSAIAGNLLCNGIAGTTEQFFLNQGCTKDGYYHFKIAAGTDSATISYDTSDGTELLSGTYTTESGEVLQGISEYTIPVMGGGVYSIEDGVWTRQTFDEAGWTMEYLDSERRSAFSGRYTAYLDSDFHWYNLAIGYTNQQELENIWVNSTLTSSTGVEYTLDGVNQVSIGDSAPLFINPTSDMTVTPSYWWRNEDTVSASGGMIANYTVQVEASKDVFLNSLKLYGGKSSASRSRNKTDTCFYNLGGNLLVSFDFLKESGYASAFNEIPGGNGYIITTRKGAIGNVVLLPDYGKILVGNTLYSTGNDILVYDYNGTKYINYRACIGWTASLLCINNDGVLAVYEQGTARDYTKNCRTGAASVSTFFPSASTSVGTYFDANESAMVGIRMTATYPLGNYLVVISDGTVSVSDMLFTVKRRTGTLNGQPYDLGDDSYARDMFKQMTGFSLDSLSDEYSVQCYALDKNNRDGTGMDYIEIPANNANGKSAITVGYVYYPRVYSDVTEAFPSVAMSDDNYPLPLVKYGRRILDLNLNMYSIGEMAAIEEFGTMPSMFHSGDENDKECSSRISANGSVQKTGDMFENGTMDNVIIYPAPVAVFASIFHNATVQLNSIFNNGSRVYYGTSKCSVYKLSDAYTLSIGGLVVTKDDGKSCYRALTGTSGSSIYVLNDDSMGVNTIVEDKNLSLTDIDALLEDVDGLVDWDQYKFSRLIQEADKYTSILIIFALCVLPRVALLLFLLLMCLALIRDFPLWQRFCDSVFDVYKLLTLGKQNVHTINVKQLFIYSIIAQALFIMIMDGALFNFIEWVSVFFFTLAQR